MSANCLWTLFKADSDSAGLEWGLRACISSVSPGDADTEVQGLHLGYCCCYLITAVVFDSLGAPWTVAYQVPLPCGFLGKNTRVSCHFLLQGIFPTQGLNLGLPHCTQMLYHLSHQGSLLVTMTFSGLREKQPHFQGAAAVLEQEGPEELLHVQGQEG